MPVMTQAISAVFGILAGIVVSGLLYAVVVGLLSAVFGGDAAGAAPPLWHRSWQFGMTFGLIAGAHLGLAATRRVDQRTALIVKIALVAVVLLALFLVFTGGRWNAMFDGLGGPLLVLVIAWMAVTHFLAKAIGTRR